MLKRVTILALIMIATRAGAFCQSPNPYASPSPTPTATQLAVREELNRAAQSYKEGHFTEAQQHAEQALNLDPANRTAHIFLARIIHQQYRHGVETRENIDRARAAILVYQAILDFEPNNEEAYKAVAVLYASIHDDESLRGWLMKRASDLSQSNKKRAEAYAVLAGRDWDCAFKITELPAVKVVEMLRKTSVVVYRMPKDIGDFEKAKQCVSRGMEMAAAAIALDAESETAWSYKTNLLIEEAKLAQMEGREEAKDSFLQASKVASAEAARLTEKRRREEENGKNPPDPDED